MNATPIKDRYDRRIRALLKKIRVLCVSAGYPASEVSDMHCDDYRWMFLVGDIEIGKAVDFTIQICESDQFDGTDEGINFSFDVVEYGGRMLGGITPFNYSPQVWVALDKPEEIEARFKCLEDADYSNIPKTLARSCVAQAEVA